MTMSRAPKAIKSLMPIGVRSNLRTRHPTLLPRRKLPDRQQNKLLQKRPLVWKPRSKQPAWPKSKLLPRKPHGPPLPLKKPQELLPKRKRKSKGKATAKRQEAKSRILTAWCHLMSRRLSFRGLWSTHAWVRSIRSGGA